MMVPRRKTMEPHRVGRADLGYGTQMPYLKYLNTSEWKAKRSKALRRDGHRCVLCFVDGPLDVHHVSYERLGNERLNDLMSLCRSCHQWIDKNPVSIKHAARLRSAHRERLASG